MAVNWFEDLKVLDLGRGISAPFCAKMFADLGASVIKIEPPEGDFARDMGPFPNDVADSEASGIFLGLNTNKSGITLDVGTDAGRQVLIDLVKAADLMIENFVPGYLDEIGLGFDELRKINPRLILTSVSPFGQTGRWSQYRANNLIISNLSGHSMEHPGPVDDIKEQPPLQLAVHQAEFIGGLCAATASVLALNRRDGREQGCHVDISEIESLALLPQTPLVLSTLGLPAKSRSKADGGKTSLLAVLPCKDGYVGISPRQQDQWERMVEIMDAPSWAQDVKFVTEQSRLDHWGELEQLLAAWTGSLNKEDVYRLCQSTRIPSFPLNNAGDLFDSVQFKARGFFVEADHPVAGKLIYPAWPFQLGSGQRVNITSAPLLGQNNADFIW
ncbi:MAG: CoA transferase [Chloroflexota bacterium]|nr:CoA transferase [Chloroflexota bacterium]